VFFSESPTNSAAVIAPPFSRRIFQVANIALVLFLIFLQMSAAATFDRIFFKANRTEERMLPTWKNYPGGKNAGRLLAALFVGNSSEKTRGCIWNIAGTALLDSAKGY